MTAEMRRSNIDRIASTTARTAVSAARPMINCSLWSLMPVSMIARSKSGDTEATMASRTTATRKIINIDR